MPRYIPFPDEAALPAGALRELTLALYDLYVGAGKPPLRTMEHWVRDCDEALDVESYQVISELLKGVQTQPAWEKVQSLAVALTEHNQRGGEPTNPIERLHALWEIVHRPPVMVQSPSEHELQLKAPPVAAQIDTSAHFARAAFDWGSNLEDSQTGGLSGAVAISYANLTPEVNYRRVFDQRVQTDVAWLQEEKTLRRDGHSFHRNETVMPSSYRVWGSITHSMMASSLVGVEMHAQGAVSVYFREDVTTATVDELVAWWIFGAWTMALRVHMLLGVAGQVHASVAVDLDGVAEGRDRSRSRFGRRRDVQVMQFGLVDLPSAGRQEAFHLSTAAAEPYMPSVRNSILRQIHGVRPENDSDLNAAEWDMRPAWGRFFEGRPAGIRKWYRR